MQSICSHSSAVITQMYAESAEEVNFVFQSQNVQNVQLSIYNAFLNIIGTREEYKRKSY